MSEPELVRSDARSQRFLRAASHIALAGFRAGKGANRQSAVLQYVNILLFLYTPPSESTDDQVIKGLSAYFEEIVASDIFAVDNYEKFDAFCASVRNIIADLDLRLFLLRS